MFSTADHALRVQRRALAKELREFLGDASSISGMSKEAFMEKKGYFEGMWKEIVSNTEGGINLLDDDVEEDGHIAEGLMNISRICDLKWINLIGWKGI